jgi:hypothetical protein
LALSVFTQAHLDNLDAMIASGVLSTRFEGREVVYRSMDELRQARKAVADHLAAAAGTARPTYVNPAFSRGV